MTNSNLKKKILCYCHFSVYSWGYNQTSSYRHSAIRNSIILLIETIVIAGDNLYFDFKYRVRIHSLVSEWVLEGNRWRFVDTDAPRNYGLLRGNFFKSSSRSNILFFLTCNDVIIGRRFNLKEHITNILSDFDVNESVCQPSLEALRFSNPVKMIAKHFKISYSLDITNLSYNRWY